MRLFRRKKENIRSKDYLIEFRFSGYAKDTIRELKKSISRNFHVTKWKIVPHITIVGPIYSKDEKRLVKEVVKVAKNYKLIKCNFDGFESFENRVIYVGIKPSEELKQLRLEIVEKLQEFCTLSEFDYDKSFTFHATLVLKDIQRKFDRIWNFLQSWKLPKLDQYVIRITILREGKILGEYDLLQRKLLNRKQSLDRKTYWKTIELLKKIRPPTEIEFEYIPNDEKNFVLSDTHFDHKNIIRFCHRPFKSKQEMNYELVKNWNNTVNHDRIFFLGDLSFGRGRRPIDFWLGKLSGDIYHLRGNHDSDMIERAEVIPDRYGIQYKGYQFLLMHRPHRPHGYDGWIIHGDKHNGNLKDYPLIHQKNKTANVC
ncbi:MAG: 2'-5' RNA ligase family protein, partial [Candidatus Paceibacterota bacterium]